MPRLPRRVVHGASVAVTVVLAYAGGVLTGVVGSQEHPRPGKTGVVDEAAGEIADHAAHPVDRHMLERAAVDGMLHALDDPWSRYYTPGEYESFQSGLDGHYAGVGVWLQRGRSGLLKVSSVQPGSPAARGGVRQGDEVVRVAGHALRGRAVTDAVAYLRGRPDSTVKLTVRRDGETRRLTLVRADLLSRDVQVEHLDGHVMLVTVSEFTRGVGRQVRKAVRDDPRGHAGGIVLDLRGDPGGLLDEAVETASAFLDGGPVVSYERRGQGRHELDAVGDGDTTTPLVVLVDERTASAAEVVAGALQDRNRAVVVGSRTFGKGSVQEARLLKDGSALELTVGTYVTPSGRSIDGVGIEPDILVAPGSPPEVAKRRVLDVLAGLLAALPDTKG